MSDVLTGQLPVQRSAETLVNQAASAQGMRPGRRPARGHGAEQRGLAYVPVSRLFEGRFGRMFRLPPFIPSASRIDEIAEVMTEGAAGGDPTLNNPTIPSGYTYLGQFIDHDLTFDPVSSLVRQNDPDALTDFRSPRFDLDSMYGRGPSDDAYLYDRDEGQQDKLLIGHHDNEDDLPRNQQDTALIGDPRNDENTFVGQLHLTMLKFHNKVVDRVRSDPSLIRGSETVFEASQRIVRWHYQWMVVHDFLRRTVGQEMLDSVLDESHHLPMVTTRHYDVRSTAPYMPVEFAVAAYRFGHSQVRGRYQLNSLVGPLATFLPGSDRDPALRLQQFGGFRVLPPFWTIEWRRFFEVAGEGDGPMQQTRLIDTLLANPLKDLPKEIAGNPSSLIKRNLMRGARLALPSGQSRRAGDGRRRAQQRRARPAGRQRGGAALVLRPAGGPPPGRGPPPRPGRRSHRRGGVHGADGQGPVLLPAARARLEAVPAVGDRRGLHHARPRHLRRPRHGHHQPAGGHAACASAAALTPRGAGL